MTARPHDRPEFYNAVTYAVTVTITVEGGKRRGTADRRARKVAERLANTAARTPGVVEVSASAGWTTKDGEVHWPERVRFAEANSGQGTHADPIKLDRYLDPDHELALRSLAEENAAAEQRRQTDRDRRRTAGCRNTYEFARTDRRYCECVYCQPDRHYDAVRAVREGRPCPDDHRCLCGQPVPAHGDRCLRHTGTVVVALDTDPASLQLLAHTERRDGPREHEPTTERQQSGEQEWDL
jgi:hypothetical protein